MKVLEKFSNDDTNNPWSIIPEQTPNSVTLVLKTVICRGSHSLHLKNHMAVQEESISTRFEVVGT